jgi:hypothetical protein
LILPFFPAFYKNFPTQSQSFISKFYIPTIRSVNKEQETTLMASKSNNSMHTLEGTLSILTQINGISNVI